MLLSLGTETNFDFVFLVCGFWECLESVMIRACLADQNEWSVSLRVGSFSGRCWHGSIFLEGGGAGPAYSRHTRRDDYIAMAGTVMDCIVMDYIVMAYIVMACIVMACIVLST